MTGGQRLQLPLSLGSRPEPAGTLTASWVFAWRAVLKIRHVPEQLADVIFIPVMFTLLFTYLFGGALAGSTSAYLAYLLPGTLVMALTVVSIYSGVSLNTDLAGGAFDRFRSLPISRQAFLFGSLLGDLGRYALASALVIAVGLALGFRPSGGFFGVAGAVALALTFALSLSWPWLVLGLVMRTPGAVQVFGWVVLLPMTFVSNIFVDAATTPGWLQALINVNPVTHVVSAVRGLMHGTVAPSEIGWVVLTSVALITVFAPLSVHLYRTKT